MNIESRTTIVRAASRPTSENISIDRPILALSTAQQAALDHLMPAVRTDMPILIMGPTGSGKEELAKHVHTLSRPKSPFVGTNIAAFPEALVESELFGHESGAFTGARQQKRGLMDVVGDGTLLLDEIGEMAPYIQVKLLRALQERRFRRLGGTIEIEFRGRLITATNADLNLAMKEGRFRQDLYYRIAGRTVSLPALTQQLEDIWPLFKRVVELHTARYGRNEGVPLFDEEGMIRVILLRHSWPGNFRELDTCAENAVIDSHKYKIPIRPETVDKHVKRDVAVPMEDLTLSSAEKRAIERALAATNGVPARAAIILKISPQTVNRKISEYGIDVSRFRSKVISKLET